MATLQNSCSACYKAQAPECCEYYLIGGLVPGTEYHVAATDSRGRVYEIDADGEPVDVNGKLKIIFPDGVNTVAQGRITIQLFLGSDLALDLNLCKPQLVNTCDGEFDCIELSFYKSMPSPAPYWEILCLCDEEPVCDGMCGVPENGFGITEFVGFLEDPSTIPNVDGCYIHETDKVLVLVQGDKIVDLFTCCAGIIDYYPTDGNGNGPYKFDEETSLWESLLIYQPLSSDFGVSLTFGGTIPEFSTGVLQVSTDSGATWGTISSPFTKAQLTAGVTVNTALTSYRSRISVTLPDGCTYISAVSTVTE